MEHVGRKKAKKIDKRKEETSPHFVGSVCKRAVLPEGSAVSLRTEKVKVSGAGRAIVLWSGRKVKRKVWIPLKALWGGCRMEGGQGGAGK